MTCHVRPGTGVKSRPRNLDGKLNVVCATICKTRHKLPIGRAVTFNKLIG